MGERERERERELVLAVNHISTHTHCIHLYSNSLTATCYLLAVMLRAWHLLQAKASLLT